MKLGIYPGSFEPMTIGHLDIIERAARLVDKLVVAILFNPNKKSGLLTFEERKTLIEAATKHIPNVEITCFSGLLVDYAKKREASVIIRGIRSSKDLDMELGMAQINQQLGDGLETIFLMTAPEHAHISSSVVREIMAFGGDFKAFVPEVVYKKLKNYKVRGNEGGECKVW